MTYRNFGPEMLNAGRTRRPVNSINQIAQPTQREYAELGQPKTSAVNDLTQELQAIANELGRLKAAQSPNQRPVYNRPIAAPQGLDATQLNSTVQSLKNDIRTQMRDDLDLQYVRLREELDSLNSAIAGTALQNSFTGEISELMAGLEVLANGNRSIQTSQDNLSNFLERELGELQKSLHGLARSEGLNRLDDRWNMLENRWKKLEDRLENSQNVDSGAHFSDISARIAALHDKMNDGGLEALENRLLMLAKSVDALAQNRGPATIADFGQIDKRFDELSRAVAAIGTDVPAPAFDTQVVDQIEKAISLLSRKIELMATMTGQNPALEALEAQLSLLTDRFADLPNYLNQQPVMERIDRLADKVSAIPSPSLSPASIDALTNQLNLLAGEIRGNSGAAPLAAGMFDRLDNRLGAIENRIQNLSFGETAPASTDSTALIAALESRFADLTAHLEAMQPASAFAMSAGENLDALERKLADLSQHLTQRPEVGDESISFERLENQISDLTAMLSRQPADDNQAIAERFDALESLLSQNQHTVLETARKAAEDAATRFQGSSPNTDNAHIVSVIAGELATLEQLTRTSNERSTSAFEGIHGALTNIADRLASLETRPVTLPVREPALAQTPKRDSSTDEITAPRMPAAAFPEDAFFPTHANSSDFEAPSVEVVEADLSALDVQSESQPRKARSPSEMAQEAANAALRNAGDPIANATNPGLQRGDSEDVPLNPGASVPDLNSILKRVRDQKKAAQSQVAKDVDRKDHFLSIKRAAQAAAAEVQQVEAVSKSGGALGNVKALYGKFRRPILMVAAAAIIAIGALQLTSALFSNETNETAEVSLEIPQQTPSDIAPARDTEISAIQSATLEPAPSVASPTAGPLNDVSNIAQQAAVPAGIALETPRVVDIVAEPAPGTVAASASAIDPNAATSVGTMPGTEIGVTDLTAAIPEGFGPKALVDAAKNNEAKAQFEIGRRLAENQGDPSALNSAFAWFNAAAAQGFAPAQYRVGNMYEKGLGVERSANDAKLWYQMSAEAGNASAMHNLAVLFASGADGTVDGASALRWFQKAADLGVGDSQFNLGVMTGKGQGTPQDLEESFKWLAILAKSGDNEAATKRDEVGKMMRPEQLQSAKAKVDLWKPKPAISAANDISIPDNWKIANDSTASVDVKKAVKNVQLILAKLGYNVGTPDGVMGENTRKAIRAFQKKENLSVNGEIDGPLVKALLAKNT